MPNSLPVTKPLLTSSLPKGVFCVKMFDMDVSIIIVNYNTRELLRDCLISIYKHTTEINFEVIVSDNGSVDGSIEMLKQDFPQVVLIENNANLGFGRANNRGLAIAKGKCIVYRDSYRSFESFPNLNKLHRQYLCFLIDSSDFVSGTDNKARLNGHIVF